MPSEVSICNLALTGLGAQKITSLSDSGKEAETCNDHYPAARDAVLEENHWRFATWWETLAPVASKLDSEFANGYQIPPDVIRVVFVGQDYDHPADYQRYGDEIHTDDTTCIAKLIHRIEDPSRFSPMFVQALAARLMAEMAITIAESRTLEQQKWQLYERKMQRAQTFDSAQGRPRRIRSRWLHEARSRGPRVAGPYV